MSDHRYNFASLAKWIERGEAITITRNGRTFATLSPAKSEESRKVNWVARFVQRKPLGKGLSKTATKKPWSDLRD